MKLLAIVSLICLVQALYCDKDDKEIAKEVEDVIKKQLEEIGDFPEQDEELNSETLADIAKELKEKHSIDLDDFLEEEDAQKQEQKKQDPGFRIRRRRRRAPPPPPTTTKPTENPSETSLMALIRYLLALLQQRGGGGFFG